MGNRFAVFRVVAPHRGAFGPTTMRYWITYDRTTSLTWSSPTWWLAYSWADLLARDEARGAYEIHLKRITNAEALGQRGYTE